MKVKISIAVILLLFVGLQFCNQPLSRPPVTGKIQGPSEVIAILDRACADCHSNENRLHWYDKLAPASWLVNADIRRARGRFNLSTWDSLAPAEQQAKWWEMLNMMINGQMPLGSYLAIHRGARITAKELAVLKEYLKTFDHYKMGDTALVAAADREYAVCMVRDSGMSRAAGNDRHSTLVAVDGVRYESDFTRWQVISTTNRFDNHSIRVVYANDLAVKAIRDGRVQSFPEGAVIVKAVWNSIEDTAGHVRPGSVNSIQLMVKDSRRFPATKGWGFAKFNGFGLAPYGADARFNTTCFNCHTMASAFGYVFNIPPKRVLFDAAGQGVITSFADNRQQLISTLYGNAAAQGAARGGVRVPGAAYTLVTWTQVKNTYWYGSLINGSLVSVERVFILPDSRVDYEVSNGCVPADNKGNESDRQSRIDLILGLRPSVFP